MSTQWRLTLDAPAPFGTEAGHIRTVHCADFRDSEVEPVNTYRDPLTGIVMLAPSVFSPEYHAGFEPLSSWNVNTDFWRDHQRALNQNGATAPLLGTTNPAGMSPTLITLLSVTAILAVQASVQSGDTLVWAAESKFTLAADEGFVLHYHSLNDELLRPANWFAVQWGGIAVHFDSSGVVRVYQYPGGDTSAAPALFGTVALSNAGELHNRPGYFWFLPIPGVGLLINHGLTGQTLGAKGSNASQVASRGVLIPLPSSASSGVYSMLPAGAAVRLALNPHLKHIVGFQHLTFPASGTYVDAPFDPGSLPTTSPVSSVVPLPTVQSTITPTLNTADNSAAWAIGDGQARMSLALSTSDARYTPFLYAYQASWPPVITSREPTPLVIGWTSDGPNRLTHLEFSDDEYARFEGSAGLILGSAHGRTLAERGDATFLLEKSLDGGATWATHAGGLARQKGGAVYQIAGPLSWYEATWTLSDFWARLGEMHEAKPWAKDGAPVAAGIDAVLLTSGFAAIASYPALAETRLLPQAKGDQQFQFAPRVGDSGEKILQTLLLFLRGYDTASSEDYEYRLRYDWPSHVWVLEEKPRLSAWTLTAFSGEADIAWETLSLDVDPPEFNKLSVWGITGTDPNAAATIQTAPIINQASLTDGSSVDYLGRLVPAQIHALGLSTYAEANAMAARIYQSAGHRRLQPKLTVDGWADGLLPCSAVAVRALLPDGTRGTLYTVWLKRRSLRIEQDGVETMTLDCDSQWLGELEV